MNSTEHDPHRAQREATAEYIKDLTEQTGVAPSAMTREELVLIGKAGWEQSYKHTRDDEEAFNLLATEAKQLLQNPHAHLDPFGVARASSFLYLPAEQVLLLWAARWADQGFPVIQMGHKYAAALMATAATVGTEEVHPPFHAFLISLPNGLISVTDPNTGKLHEATRIVVQRSRTPEGVFRWSYIIQAGRLSLWRHGVFTAEMIESDLDQGHDWASYSFGLERDERDERVYSLAQRLILNVCLAMATSGNSKPMGKTARLSAGNVRESKEPLVRVFQLGKPIKLDCRPALRDYLEGEKRSGPTVQVLVRGHWKNQPHGPKRAHRKRIWIEPYWRGPEDAPILTRPHEL